MFQTTLPSRRTSLSVNVRTYDPLLEDSLHELFPASYIQFESGTDAAKSFQADASLSAKYLAVSGSVDATYAINKTFHNDYQYAMFSYNQHLYFSQFEDFASSIQEQLIKNRVNQLKPFDPTDNAVIDTYRSFFKTMGSHCITGAGYGSRMQLVSLLAQYLPSVNS